MSDRSPFTATPPHSAESEAALLGALICDGKQVEAVGKLVSASDFYLLKHQSIYESILRCAAVVAGASRGTLDIVQLRESLAGRGLLDDVGGVQYLVQLAESCPDASNASHYARIIREHAATRGILAAASDVLASGGNGTLESAVARFGLAVDLAKPVDDTPRFQFYTDTEFDALDLRTEWHIPGLLAAGALPCMVAGAGKTLKTSVILHMLVCLASGTPFLGHDVRQCPVAIMSGETGGSTLQDLLRRIRQFTGTQPTGMLHLSPVVPSLRAADDIAEMEKVIASTGSHVFVIDPAYLALRGLESPGDIFAVGEFLLPITELAARTGCTPIIIHHVSKGAARERVGEPAELPDMAMAGFDAWAAQWLLLSRRRKYDAANPGEHEMWLNIGGRDGHSKLLALDIREGAYPDRYWRVEVNSAAEAREAASEAAEGAREAAKREKAARQLEADADAIYGALSYGPSTERDLRGGRAGVASPARVSAAIARLLRDRKIEECEVQKAKQTYRGYRLV